MNSPLARKFERMAGTVFGHIHSWDLFRDWLTASWLFLESYQDRGAKLTQFIDHEKRWSHEQGKALGELLFCDYLPMVEAEPFKDHLGEAFMELDLASVRAGQYFTPWQICVMMAEMTFDESLLRAKVAAGEKLTVNDPCCGSGAMLLAFAAVVTKRMGREYLRHVEFYGQDIDERCCNMARIQVRLNGMDSIGRLMGTRYVAEERAEKDAPQSVPPQLLESNPTPAVCTRQASPSVKRGQLELF